MNSTSPTDTEETMVNASITDPPMTRIGKATHVSATDSISALAGTWCFDRCPKDSGACFDWDNPYSMREVEKIPEFALEEAEVRTTKFMAPAAATNPTMLNRFTE